MDAIGYALVRNVIGYYARWVSGLRSTLNKPTTGNQNGGGIGRAGVAHFIMGGQNSGSAGQGHIVYDPVANSWSIKAEHNPRVGNTARCLDDSGRIIVFGGSTDSSNVDPVATVQRYDPVSNTWTLLANMPKALHYPAGGRIGSKMWISAGRGPSRYTDNTATYAYDIPSNTWSSGYAATPRGGESTDGCAFNGRLHQLGNYNSPYDQHYAYDPVSNTWTTLASLEHRGNIGMGVTELNQLVARGGTGSYYDLNQYQPAENRWILLSNASAASALNISNAIAIVGSEVYCPVWSTDTNVVYWKPEPVAPPVKVLRAYLASK